MTSPQLTFEPGAAVIAGGSGGIGASTARLFGASGVPVVLTYHSNKAAADAVAGTIGAAGGDCEVLRCDLTVPEEVEDVLAQARARYDRVGHVVYAAGPSFAFNFIGAIPDSEWHRVLAADVNGCFHLTQSAVRTFRNQGGGNLVAVTTAAVGRTAPGDVLSAAPKSAIETLIRGVAKEAGRFGVRANCVGPGWIDAGLGERALRDQLDERQRDKIRAEVIPLRRFGAAEEVGFAVLYLCSQQAGFITGQSLAVDGGAQL
ncbi:MAG TPA: SDR family oxidoreductase [Pseudonocardia sp.]|jgi:NAD(P)-dependent dehydrogenase (short-subunit alcohol dehydrogenase family)